MSNKLYSESSNKELKRWLIWSIFVYSCLVFNILEPFEISIDSFRPIYHLVLCGHGVVAALLVFLLHKYLEPFVRRGVTNWNISQTVAWLLVIVILSSIFNWIYALGLHYTISGWHDMYVPIRGFFEVVPKFIAIYSVWGLLSALSIYLLFNNRGATQNSIAHEISKQNANQSEDMVLLYSENQADKFRIKEADIICFRTCDNYLELFYLSEDRQLKNRLIRSSMKKMMDGMSQKNFIRCHQSFLVNKNHIKGMVRIKTQCFIELAYLDFNVSVSRSNVKAIKALIA